MRDWYVARGFPEENIRVVGYPLWDKWVEATEKVDRDHACMVLQLEPDRPIVLFCTSWAQYTNMIDDHTVMKRAARAILKATKAQGWQLIWSLHPGEPPGTEKSCAEAAKRYGVPALITRRHLSYTTAAADAVVAVGPSNVLIEAAIADRPIASIHLRGYGFPSTPPWTVRPTKTSMEAVIGRMIADRSEWDAARDGFVERFAHLIDGKATERVVGYIREIINV